MTHPDRPQPVRDLSPARPYDGGPDGPAPGWTRIPPQTGLLVELAPGQLLEIVDPCGEQVSDLYLVSRNDVEECFSAGRTVDYNNTLYVSVGSKLWSNRSAVMASIVEDTVGVHDMTLTPCLDADLIFISSGPVVIAALVGGDLTVGVGASNAAA